MTRTRALWVAVAIGSPFAAAPAQESAAPRTVSGYVRDGAGFPVRGARVGVSGQSTVATTDSTGRYRLAGTARGPLQLVVRRLGFAPETLQVPDAPSVERADLTLGRPVDQMPTVLVKADAASLGFMAGFYERSRQGRGRFLTNEDITRRGYSRMSDVLRSVPGMMSVSRSLGRQGVRMRSSRQAPLVWLDGTPLGSGEFDLDSFDPRSFAGVEIYSGAGSVPIEFAGSPTMSTAGGAIILWTRRGEVRRARPAPRRTASTLLVQDLLERGEAFRVDDVEPSVRPAGGTSALVPAYPEALARQGISGTIVVEFVVDSAGAVRMPTFGVVLTSHALLVDPVRQALAGQRFTPARRAGRPVAQVVVLPFTFTADTARSTSPDR